MKKYEKQKGFTLIELVFYLGLAIAVTLAGTLFVWDVMDNKTKAMAYQEVQQNARFTLERMTKAVKSAENIDTGNSVFNIHPGQLSLVMSESSLNPTVFQISANKALQIKQGVGAWQDLTSGQVEVDKLVFTNLSYPIDDPRTKNIQIELTIKHKNPGGLQAWRAQITATTTVELGF